MLKHFYDYEVTCMQVSILCVWTMHGIQSDSIVTTQHSNAWLCEHACIYAIGVQTVQVNSMLAPNNLIVVKYAPKMANQNICCDVLKIYRYPCPYYLPMPLFISLIFVENIGPADAGPTGPVPTPISQFIYFFKQLNLRIANDD